MSDAHAGVTAVENGVCSGSVTSREASSAASSRAGSVANLSPVPSQSIDAKPFVPGAAEPRCAHTACLHSLFHMPAEGTKCDVASRAS